MAVPFWANTQLLWYRKSVAKAAGLDMTKPVTWEQLIEAAGQGSKTLGVQGQRYEGYDRLDQRPGRIGAGGHILENPGATADQVKLGLDSQAGTEAAHGHPAVGTDGLGGPALLDPGREQSADPVPGRQGRFMVNWPYVWPATNATVKDGTWTSLIKDIGWALYPRDGRGRAIRAAARRHRPGRRGRQHTPRPGLRRRECIASPENQTATTSRNGNPAANTEASTTIRGSQAGLPDGRHHPRVLETAAPRPQTLFYSDVSTGLQRNFAPPDRWTRAARRRPTSDLIISVLQGETPAVSTTTKRPARPGGQTGRTGRRRTISSSATAPGPSARSAGWLAGPGLRRHAGGHGLPDPAGVVADRCSATG